MACAVDFVIPGAAEVVAHLDGGDDVNDGVADIVVS